MEQLESLYQSGFIQKLEYVQRKNDLLASSISRSPLSNSGYIPYEEPPPTLASGYEVERHSGAQIFNSYEHRPVEKNIREVSSSFLQERRVRLFVSSTLRDMKEERALLVQQVFPELKQFCRDRHVEFSYVDLQWGITSEEAVGGQVIELCMDEIDRCRPYLLGVLGERYGWAAGGSIPDKLLNESFHRAAEQRSWLSYYTDRSVTELEMLYGALFYPEHSRASFYFRDVAYSNSISDARDIHENALHKDKLLNLKARIRASGLLVRDNYSNPKEFAKSVSEDLKAAIESDFPLAEVSKIAGNDYQQAILFAADRGNGFVGGDFVLQALNDHLRDSVVSSSTSIRSSAPLVLQGDPGSGKTAIISHWITKFLIGEERKPIVPLVPIFVGLLHTSPSRIIYSILSQLKNIFGWEKKIPSDAVQLLSSLTEWFVLVPSKVVIILEGAHLFSEQSFAWLPMAFPSQVRVVVTTRPDSPSLRIFQLRGWTNSVSLLPLEDREIRLMIESNLASYGKKLSHNQTQSLVSAKVIASSISFLLRTQCSSNPLYLRTVLDQLRVYSDFDRLDRHLQDLADVRSLADLFSALLSQWETECGETVVRTVLSLLAVSHVGMTEPELFAITQPKSQVVWSRLFRTMGESLTTHAGGGLIRIANNCLETLVWDRYLHNDSVLAAQRERIVRYFETKSPRYRKSQEYPWQLMHLQRAADMLTFLTSSPTVFLQLYTPETRFDFLKYWHCAKVQGTPLFPFHSVLTIQLSRREVINSAVFAVRFAEFLQEVGHPKDAVSLLQPALPPLKLGASTSQKYRALYHDALSQYAHLLVNVASFDLADSALDELAALDTGDRAEILWLRGLSKKKQGAYEESRVLFADALSIARLRYGSGHPLIAKYLKTLGDVDRKLAAYVSALEVYEEALAISRLVYGDVHPQVAEALDSLGRVYKKQGRYEDAKAQYEEALAIIENVYGPTHLSYGETCLNLGDVERKLSNLDRALELYQTSLKINESALGPHPEVAETQNSIGMIYKIRGQLDAAIEIIGKAIAIVSELLGPENVKLARFYNNLADCRAIKAEYTLALDLYHRALAINKAVLGPDHPEVSENLNAIGKIEKKRGRYDQALTYYTQAMEIVEKAFGPDHVKVALYAHDLGVAYRKLQEFDKSLEFYQRALDLNTVKFGPQSSAVAMNLNGIGMLYKVKGGEYLDQAEQLHTSALMIFEKHYGRYHEKVALTLNLLAEVARKKGRYEYDGAERLYIRALQINEETFGREHPEIAENLNGLAQVYKHQMNYPKSEAYFREAIAISERTLGTAHPHVINRYRNLADMYERVGNVEDAKKTWAIVEERKQSKLKNDTAR